MRPERIAERFQTELYLTPVVATEIEFYLHGASQALSKEAITQKIAQEAQAIGVRLDSIEEERGPDQFEVAFIPSSDVGQMVADTERFKAHIRECFSPHSAGVDFRAKPLADAPGSGLHVHMHLADASGTNQFYRDGEDFSQLLRYSIGGMLALMNASMIYFAPSEASYARFVAQSNAPLTVSWGTNNRTVAVRLPAKPMGNKHIEHRVAGADADVARVISVILAAAHYGIMHQCDPGVPIYGDAALAQYNMPRLATTWREAEIFAADSAVLKEYLSAD